MNATGGRTMVCCFDYFYMAMELKVWEFELKNFMV